MMSKTTSEYNFNSLIKSMEFLKAVAHPIRLSIVKLIYTHGETNVNKIYTDLKLEQSITSQHLKVLRDYKYVSTRRDGKYIYYTVNEDKLYTIGELVNDFMEKGKASS